MKRIPESQKCRTWREARGLTVDQLADLTGYSPKALYWLERGITPPQRNAKGGNPDDRKHKPWVLQRFRMACAGVEAQMASGKPFAWDP